MKVKYFQDTDTLYLSLSTRQPTRTEQVNEYILLELDQSGALVGLTIEHAKEGESKLNFSYETVEGAAVAKV
jgi:uncharacterized protein YuzE